MAMSLDSIPLGVVCPKCGNGIASTYGLLRLAGRLTCDDCSTVVLVQVNERELRERIHSCRAGRLPPPARDNRPSRNQLS